MILKLTLPTRIKKERIAWLLFMMSALVAFFGSLHPWFMWPLEKYYTIVAAFIMVVAMVWSMTLGTPVFTSKGHMLPVCAFTLFIYYVSVVVDKVNVVGMAVTFFHVIFFLGICVVNKQYLRDFGDVLAKIMGTLASISFFAFVLYLLGFSLPYVSVSDPNDMYSFTNYYLFLLDDRSLWAIIPRFNCVFLEPGHFGVACVHILLLQCGRWKKWYNIVLIAGVLSTFSLEAYVEFFVLIFGSMWVQRKHIARKLTLVVLLISTVVTGAFFYNRGDNMFHDLILLRLEVDDGDIAGNNRVTEDFDAIYESYIDSSEIVFGARNAIDTIGNSGYKVFIYLNGLFGLLIFAMFFLFMCAGGKDWRITTLAMVIALLHFIVRAHTIWYCNLLPIYCMVTAYGLKDIVGLEKKESVAEDE